MVARRTRGKVISRRAGRNCHHEKLRQRNNPFEDLETAL
ncbi:hypothetical protein CEV34_3213 [Brucella pseudogrignonensis]|uniref:Uncharacterized protein n=1 Tax=Brucella pseudogrignonensis TaxID=419475 RepID=A0A256GBU8_9HYPH|nr:hypothetical protein CEV34_3213 [Brucella pseudogrignonensis]